MVGAPGGLQKEEAAAGGPLMNSLVNDREGIHRTEWSSIGARYSRGRHALKQAALFSFLLCVTPLRAVAQTPDADDRELAEPPRDEQSEDADADSRQDRRPGGGSLLLPAWISFGVGVGGLTAGIFLAQRSSSLRTEAEGWVNACGLSCSREDIEGQRAQELFDKAGTAQTFSTIGFVVGGAGVVVATTFLLLDASKGAAVARSRGVRPWLGFGSVGLTGAF
jgi:hypothetical protein